MKYFLSPLTAIITVTGCAALYQPPQTKVLDFTRTLEAEKVAILAAAKQVLVSEGFQILTYDDAAGIVSTAQRSLKLTPAQADCGTTVGIDYLKDNRTSSTVSFGILVKGNTISVKPHMEASYLPGNVTQSISMVCVSRGLLESDLLEKIAQAAK